MGLKTIAIPSNEAQSLQTISITGSGSTPRTGVGGLGAIRFQTVDASPTNVVNLMGSVDGVTFFPVQSITGSGQAIGNVTAYNYIQFDTSTYGGSPFTIVYKGDDLYSGDSDASSTDGIRPNAFDRVDIERDSITKDPVIIDFWFAGSKIKTLELTYDIDGDLIRVEKI